MEKLEKTCIKCKELKEIGEFGKAKVNKDGHKGKCKMCIKEYQREYILNHEEELKGYAKEYKVNHKEESKEYTKEYGKKYYQNNKEEMNGKSREYALNHKEEKKEKAKEYYENNKEEIKDKTKEWRKNNKDRVNEIRRNYVPSDNAKIIKLLRSRHYHALKAGGAKKCASTNKLLGCSIDFYNDYIEAKFTKGMTWENRGVFGWHFDHIKPCKSFDMQDPAQQYICFHYTNMQPLWATTAIAMSYGEGPEYVGNLEKGDRIIE